MRKTLLLAVVVGLLSASAVQAAVVAGDQIKISDWAGRPGNQNGEAWFNGGPFTTTIYASNGTTQKDVGLSFCVQLDQNFSWNQKYTIADLSVKSTAADGSTVLRQLSGYSMWVYQNFLDVGLDYTSSNRQGLTAEDLRNFQRAIWAGVVTGTNAPSLATIGNSATSLFGISDWAAYEHVGGTGTGSSRTGGIDISLATFNSKIGTAVDPNNQGGLKWSYSFDDVNSPYKMIIVNGVQDQVFIGTGSLSTVPEPASIAIWSLIGGLGVAGAAMKRRKSRWSDENRQAILSIVDNAR